MPVLCTIIHTETIILDDPQLLPVSPYYNPHTRQYQALSLSTDPMPSLTHSPNIGGSNATVRPHVPFVCDECDDDSDSPPDLVAVNYNS